MKIGYDAKRLFHNFTGLGNYSRSLVKNLHKYSEEPLDLHLYSPKLSAHGRIKEFLDPKSYTLHDAGSQNTLLWRSRNIRNNLLQDKIEVYHGLSNEIPLGLQKHGIKTIVSIHDLIFLRYPNYYPFIDRQIYNFKFSYAAKHATRVLAISESTRNDLIHYYGISPEKIEVIYQACDEQFYEEKTKQEIRTCLQQHKLPENYLLYVGSITERKNLLRIVKAIEILPSSLQLPLVILGKGKSYVQTVRKYIDKKGLQGLFLFREQVPFSDFPAIYQQAKALVYPSFFEGFGIPIIEALWSGTPVISANTSSLPEAGGPDSLYVNPHKIEEIASAIERVLCEEGLSQYMSRAGKTYVQQFHGRVLSQQLLRIYQQL